MGGVCMNAIELLKTDHQKVNELFDEFDVSEDKAIADKICQELSIHAQIEEQIFYPAARKADESLVEHGLDEHQEMKEAITELRAMETVDEDFKLTMEDLRMIVEDHVEEEETELFPEVQIKMGAQLDRLGTEMMQLKEQLQQGKATRSKSA
jgi:hemerythrin superfamily protein